MTFDQHKQHLAQEYAALVHKHSALPAIKQYIWDSAKAMAKAPGELYKDFPALLTQAVMAQQEKPSDI